MTGVCVWGADLVEYVASVCGGDGPGGVVAGVCGGGTDLVEYVCMWQVEECKGGGALAHIHTQTHTHTPLLTYEYMTEPVSSPE